MQAFLYGFVSFFLLSCSGTVIGWHWWKWMVRRNLRRALRDMERYEARQEAEQSCKPYAN